MSSGGGGDFGEDDPETRAIVQQAAEWYARTINGELGKTERAKLDAWLARDARHAEAFANIGRLWKGSGEIPALKALQKKRRKPKTITRRNLGKAVLLFVAGGAAWTVLNDHPFADHRTGSGERKSFAAPDGSQIDMSAQTRLSLSFSPAGRNVELHEGEAFFRVAAGGAPFSVRAGDGVTTALGTAFGVRYRNAKARIVVIEHATRVALGTDTAELQAGYELEYGSRLGRVEQADTDEALSWREGRLVFNGTPLGEVVEALNLWRRGRIVLLDPSLARREVTFIVNIERLDTIDEQLERAMSVRVIQITPLLMFLVAAR
jgi:transmembrane sensor